MNQKRKRPQRPVSGWVIFDKPYGMGSTDAVSFIKRIYRADKAGHAGTLDPLASGILPIALGEATKTVPYVMDGTKVYRFTASWGEERSTDDLEGEVTATSDKRPTRTDIEALLPRFTGIISQIPPKFSAIKVDGERAYDLARGGEEVDLAARDIEIDRIEIVEMQDGNSTTFDVECGKGTYVRSIARDMGRLIGCYGHVSSLRRLEVSPFDEEDAVTKAELDAASEASKALLENLGTPDGLAPEAFAGLDDFLIDPIEALEGLPQIALSPDAAHRVRMGNPVMVLGRDAPVEADEAYVTERGKLIAIGEVRQGAFQPKRVFKV
ncbi:MAG: tRNA pseudouridine(55) synthase TruB [Rhizobiaceae bacterium]